MKSLFAVCHIFLCVGILLFGCGSQSGYSEGSQQRTNSSAIRIRAPKFLLVDINGKSLSLDELKGKVVFLDFWATWCPPCVWSSPQVEELAEYFKDEKFEAVSISLDASEHQVKRFFASKTTKTRVALAGDSGVDFNYRVAGIPAFYLIDQEGYLVRKWSGYHDSLPLIWKKEISKLLKT